MFHFRMIRLHKSYVIYNNLNIGERCFQIWRPCGGRDDFQTDFDRS